jgi:hypothetical protein
MIEKITQAMINFEGIKVSPSILNVFVYHSNDFDYFTENISQSNYAYQ